MKSLTVDRLRVFVSSSIAECARERAAVREAIDAINHEPVLFENIGARPHPPRDVYRSRLAIAHIFVGIYRESYGWIAPDMDISGVEDEFRIAEANGLDRLIYVYQTPTFRDPRLETLIEEAKRSELTISLYGDEVQLASRVRNDVTAAVSNRFVDQAVAFHEDGKPAEIVGALLPNPTHRFRRPAVEVALIDKVATMGRVAVTAPLGGGKTILTAQVSAREGWSFVEGYDLTPLGVLARVANALGQGVGKPTVMLATEQEAVREIQRRWGETPDATVVVDGASNPRSLWDMLPEERRFVITSRSPVGGAGRNATPCATVDHRRDRGVGHCVERTAARARGYCETGHGQRRESSIPASLRSRRRRVCRHDITPT